MKKYELPEFLKIKDLEEDVYKTWLERKAKAHYKRDLKYFGLDFNRDIKPKNYKLAIHNAVIIGEGRCLYTNAELRWDLINKFGAVDNNNEKNYNKKEFALLPTLEHIDRSEPNLNFAIVSWEINDAKNDLNFDSFMELCKNMVSNEKVIREKLKTQYKIGRHPFSRGSIEF